MAFFISDECIACGACVSECFASAISEGDVYSINSSLCNKCGACADICTADAIFVVEE